MATDPPQQPRVASPNRLSGFRGWLMVSLMASVGLVITASAMTAGVIVVLRYLPPLLAGKPPEPKRIEEIWNDSIGRLGIEPLFPPEEDVHVGDVFIVIVKADGASTNSALLRRAVKIAHLPVEDKIKQEYASLPVFPDTAPSSAADGAPWPQNPASESVFDLAKARKWLPLVAFPGFTIQRSQQGYLALGAAGQQAGLGGNSEEDETIRIPLVETYGLTAPVAYKMLVEFCDQHEVPCTDLGARKILMRSFGIGVCTIQQEKQGNQTRASYAMSIEVQAVNRVYLARSIEQKHSIQAAAGANGKLALRMQAALDTVKGQIAATPTQPNSGGDTQAVDARRQALEEERIRLERLLQEVRDVPVGSSVSIDSANSSNLILKQTFLRPLTIGFRSVKFRPSPDTDNAHEGCQ